MLTASTLLSAASIQGIFAVPTKAGERGMCLLDSLGIEFTEQDIFGLHCAGEIVLVEVDINIPFIQISLDDRDLPYSLVSRSMIRTSQGKPYHAVFAPAVATAAEGLSEKEIEAYQRVIVRSGTSSVAVDDVVRLCNWARADFPSRSMRAEACTRLAAAINHRRGVLPVAA